MVAGRGLVRRRLVVCRRLVVGGGLVVCHGLMVGSRLVVGGRFVVGGRLVVGGWGSIALSRGAVHVVLVVAGAQVLVEERAVAAVVGVLLAVGVAEVVDLGVRGQEGG